MQRSDERSNEHLSNSQAPGEYGNGNSKTRRRRRQRAIKKRRDREAAAAQESQVNHDSESFFGQVCQDGNSNRIKTQQPLGGGTSKTKRRRRQRLRQRNREKKELRLQNKKQS